MFNTPILFLLFNRPDNTERVFNQIREIKPKCLFIAADGPRTNNPSDKVLCKQTREIVLTGIDWDCIVETFFRDDNLGCKIAVSEAITWFFSKVEQGIILEDDCVPHQSFFKYCETLLEKFKNDEEVMHIGGNNFSYKTFQYNKKSYFFSAYSLIWGWATWRRAWKKFDIQLSNLDVLMDSPDIVKYLMTNEEKEFWREKFDSVKNKEFNTWDYIWQYSIWNSNGLTILPLKNLVQNIGFREDATHTNESTSNYNPIARLKGKKIDLKNFDIEKTIDRKEDIIIFNNFFLHKPNFYEKIIFKINQFRKLK